MGGAKKKSPAQQEKSQIDETSKTSGAKKKGKKMKGKMCACGSGEPYSKCCGA